MECSVGNLLHCMLCDVIRQAHLERFAADSREKLDARNSPQQPLNVYKMIAEKINDPTFVTTLIIDGGLHPTFAQYNDLSFEG